MKRFEILAFGVILAACSGGGTVVTTGDTGPEAQVAETAADVPAPLDAVDADGDLPDLGGGDALADLPPSCQPGNGCFLDPCDGPDDCLSGICLEHMGDPVCSIGCVEECPQGWLCKQINSDQDTLFACVSPYTRLCRPCLTNADCVSESGVEDVCIHYGAEGDFCGADCSQTGLCPMGFSCETAETVTGVAVKQCVAQAGVCACSKKAQALGLSTSCFVENDFGLCEGQRVCGPDGLSACDASVPEVEVCDGKDNDCNGTVDDVSCSDDNACTKDSCVAPTGCVHEPLTGTECADGDVCTLADHCEQGQCVGTAINCDDVNPCTTDSCNPSGGCIYSFNNQPCDDKDPCTIDDHCAQGQCTGFEVPCECQKDSDCVPLEDKDVCNGTLFCDKEAFPQQCKVEPDTVITCPVPKGVGAECLAAACHPLTGECSFAPANEGKACFDGDACTLGDVCKGGVCGGGVSANCNDGNPCTDDSCDTIKGCVQKNNQAACEDGNLCTVGDMCGDGKCIAGGPMACDDGNPCTDDACKPGQGCVHTANNAACDDGNACTQEDHCTAGACVAGSAVSCDDANLCTTDSCKPLVGCTYDFNAVPCNDGDACTSGDVCKNGSCKGPNLVNCNDGNVCTDDSCDPANGCIHKFNQAPCDDLNSCTTGDMCKKGVCIGTGSIECDDANPCTKDVCLPGGGCDHQTVSGACDDGDPCTVNDTCQKGKCSPGPLKSCDDGNPCTDDACGQGGTCVYTPNQAACDDANACTAGDKCDQGKCTYTGLVKCDDGNVCTTDFCDPVTGCKHQDNQVPCDDGDVCTTGDKCESGKCKGGAQLACNDGNPCTDDSCDPAKGCLFTVNQAACDDGNVCTTGDVCGNGLCKGAGALSCDDGNPCTDDSCDPKTGCAHVPNAAACDDGNACTLNDACAAGWCKGGPAPNCDDKNVCTDDFCTVDKGCMHVANKALCDDGNACTTADQCKDSACIGGPAPDCDDKNVCTDDSCEPATGCKHTNNTVGCNDFNLCTVSDKCENGACKPGTPLVCNDGKACTTDSCVAETGCQYTPITPCCGNGVKEAGEECDDGNNNSNDGCSASCKAECGNPGGGSLAAENGTNKNKMYCYNPGDSTQTRALKACESHFGIGTCCVITGGYNSLQYGKCGLGGDGGSIHWHWDSWPSGHCPPHYKPGDVVSPGWCGSIIGNFMD
ncbi:MAG: hypothetical protein FJ109_11920 [Deltaproteobacteria bacterium]|nr:hypothetical protein [Deltaproteobacteria bacterium]